MREVVLDASVVMKWFAPADEAGSSQARDLREGYRRGELFVVVPGLLFLEILNVAGRRWSWTEESLIELALALDDIEFEVVEPDLASIATWVARGLTAYDAAYVALAQSRDLVLITDDERILKRAVAQSQPLTPRRRAP